MADKKELATKLEELKGKFNVFTDNVEDKFEDGKEAVAAGLEKAKGETNRIIEELRIKSERGKSKAYSEVLRFQMNFNQKKEEITTYLKEKKYENDKDRAWDAAERSADYAEDVLDFALLVMEEAKAAYLEATEKKLAYEEKYGSEE